MINNNVVSNRYAEALFILGEEENVAEELYKDLIEVINLTKDVKELYSVLASPLVTKDEKKNLVEHIFTNQINDYLKNFLKILVDKDRAIYLENIATAYKQLLNDKNNVLEGIALTAIPMSDEELKNLEIKLSQKYSKNVILNNEIDESLLGGVLVRLGNEEIDGTVKTRLTKIKDQLSQVIS